MPYALRKFSCDTCGNYCERRLSSKDRRRCQQCGIDAMVASTLDMASKSGKSWQAWQASPGARGRPRKQPRE
jgi:hypothetical protein